MARQKAIRNISDSVLPEWICIAMNKAESNTTENTVVRFVKQGFEDASFMVGAGGFGGLAASLVIYRTVERPVKHQANHAITSVQDVSHS
jgi:hypothetical protein